MSSTSVTQSPNVLNDALPAGGGLSMGVVVNAIINEARAAAYADAPVAPNFLKDTLPDGVGLSMGVVATDKIN